MEVKYGDFLELCGVENSETWAPWLVVGGDGVYVREPPNDLEPTERAALAEHPTGNLKEPALRFPCRLNDLKKFLKRNGMYSSVDPFDLADWVARKLREGSAAKSGRDHVSDKLAALNQAAFRFWGSASRDDAGTHPKSDDVAAWLQRKGFSGVLAEKGATIIRPEWAPLGRKPQK